MRREADKADKPCKNEVPSLPRCTLGQTHTAPMFAAFLPDVGPQLSFRRRGKEADTLPAPKFENGLPVVIVVLLIVVVVIVAVLVPGRRASCPGSAPYGNRVFDGQEDQLWLSRR